MRSAHTTEAETHLPRLVQQAARGESVIVAKAGHPMVTVVAPDALARGHGRMVMLALTLFRALDIAEPGPVSRAIASPERFGCDDLIAGVTAAAALLTIGAASTHRGVRPGTSKVAVANSIRSGIVLRSVARRRWSSAPRFSAGVGFVPGGRWGDQVADRSRSNSITPLS